MKQLEPVNQLNADGTSDVESYWETRWINGQTGWDIGFASPQIIHFMRSFPNKKASILIPGCGNAHEVKSLLNLGFTNITLIDISQNAVSKLKEEFKNENSVEIICGDFFKLNATFDAIIEQTFFCAISPNLRQNYVVKMHELLSHNGILVGLLFDRLFEQGPPFGGNKSEYTALFSPFFTWDTFTTAEFSIPQRQGFELFMHFRKKNLDE